MGNPKITGFIIAILLVSFFAVVLGLFMANLSENYAPTDSYNNLTSYNKLAELNNLSKDVKDRTEIKEKDGILDIIGGYFSSGYTALKLTDQSFDTFNSIRDEGFQQAGLGVIGESLQTLVATIVIVLLFIGVFIAAIVKRDL